MQKDSQEPTSSQESGANRQPHAPSTLWDRIQKLDNESVSSHAVHRSADRDASSSSAVSEGVPALPPRPTSLSIESPAVLQKGLELTNDGPKTSPIKQSQASASAPGSRLLASEIDKPLPKPKAKLSATGLAMRRFGDNHVYGDHSSADNEPSANNNHGTDTSSGGTGGSGKSRRPPAPNPRRRRSSSGALAPEGEAAAEVHRQRHTEHNKFGVNHVIGDTLEAPTPAASLETRAATKKNKNQRFGESHIQTFSEWANGSHAVQAPAPFGGSAEPESSSGAGGEATTGAAPWTKPSSSSTSNPAKASVPPSPPSSLSTATKAAAMWRDVAAAVKAENEGFGVNRVFGDLQTGRSQSVSGATSTGSTTASVDPASASSADSVVKKRASLPIPAGARMLLAKKRLSTTRLGETHANSPWKQEQEREQQQQQQQQQQGEGKDQGVGSGGPTAGTEATSSSSSSKSSGATRQGLSSRKGSGANAASLSVAGKDACRFSSFLTPSAQIVDHQGAKEALKLEQQRERTSQRPGRRLGSSSISGNWQINDQAQGDQEKSGSPEDSKNERRQKSWVLSDGTTILIPSVGAAVVQDDSESSATAMGNWKKVKKSIRHLPNAGLHGRPAVAPNSGRWRTTLPLAPSSPTEASGGAQSKSERNSESSRSGSGSWSVGAKQQMGVSSLVGHGVIPTPPPFSPSNNSQSRRSGSGCWSAGGKQQMGVSSLVGPGVVPPAPPLPSSSSSFTKGGQGQRAEAASSGAVTAAAKVWRMKSLTLKSTKMGTSSFNGSIADVQGEARGRAKGVVSVKLGSASPSHPLQSTFDHGRLQSRLLAQQRQRPT